MDEFRRFDYTNYIKLRSDEGKQHIRLIIISEFSYVRNAKGRIFLHKCKFQTHVEHVDQISSLTGLYIKRHFPIFNIVLILVDK